MMNADEIAKALKQCAQGENCLYPAVCPFACEDDGCMRDMMMEAADLIESLQAQLAEAERRERAAVEDLKANWLCRACSKREKGREWCGCKHGDFVMDDERVVRCSHFEWRGPQEGATDEV